MRIILGGRGKISVAFASEDRLPLLRKKSRNSKRGSGLRKNACFLQKHGLFVPTVAKSHNEKVTELLKILWKSSNFVSFCFYTPTSIGAGWLLACIVLCFTGHYEVCVFPAMIFEPANQFIKSHLISYALHHWHIKHIRSAGIPDGENLLADRFTHCPFPPP